MKKYEDKFGNMVINALDAKTYQIQIRETKNRNLVMLLIPKNEAGKLDYTGKIFMGMFFNRKINFFGVNFTLDIDNLELIPSLGGEEPAELTDIPF